MTLECRPAGASHAQPKISVIIPVHNGEKQIGECLTSIFQTPIPVAYEIWVIDDGSTDRTKEVVDRFSCKYKKIQKSGVARARNTGIAAASGEILLFFDADVVLTSKTIAAFLRVFENDKEVSIAQGRWAHDDFSRNFNTGFHLDKWSYNFEKLLGGKRRVAVSELMTGCLGVRKEVFEKIGGFDEDYKRAGGEEWELGFRVVQNGYKIYYYNDISVRHDFGSFVNTVYKTYFRTVNFSILIFEAMGQNTNHLDDVKNSIPSRDKYSMVFVSLAIVAALFFMCTMLFTLRLGSFDPQTLFFLPLFFFGLYLYNARGFFHFLYDRKGLLFTLRGIGADLLIISQKVLGVLSAIFYFYVLRVKHKI